jgi:hypothetical protein
MAKWSPWTWKRGSSPDQECRRAVVVALMAALAGRTQAPPGRVLPVQVVKEIHRLVAE